MSFLTTVVHEMIISQLVVSKTLDLRPMLQLMMAFAEGDEVLKGIISTSRDRLDVMDINPFGFSAFFSIW